MNEADIIKIFENKIGSSYKIVDVMYGSFNLSYHVANESNNYIFRAYIKGDATYPVDKKLQEICALNILQIDNIAPNVIDFDFSKKQYSHPYLIEEYVGGSTLDINKIDVGVLAKTLHGLHSHLYDDFGFIVGPRNLNYSIANDYKTFCLDIFEYIHANDFSIPHKEDFTRIYQTLKLFFESSTEFDSIRKFNLVHNDLNPTNILASDNSIKLIDFEYAAIGIKERDIAYLLQRCDADEEVEKQFLDAYCLLFDEDSDKIVSRVKKKKLYNEACRSAWCISRLNELKSGLIDPALIRDDDYEILELEIENYYENLKVF